MKKPKVKQCLRWRQNSVIINEATSPFESASVEQLSAILQRLEVNNADLRKINDEIETCLAEDAYEEEFEESIQYNDKANQTIGLLKAKMASAITPSSSETSHLLPSQTHNYGVKLPKLHLKLFGTELFAWQAF